MAVAPKPAQDILALDPLAYAHVSQRGRSGRYGLALLVLFVLAVLSGCEDNGNAAGPDATSLEDRIPVAIPATIVFEGRTYAAVDKTPTKVKVIPGDLSPAGFVTPRPGEERVALQGSDPRVFSIKGIDKSQAVAIRFWSANGRYFYYLEYQVRD